uniref:Uncharacterized protein n=1 Tax=Rhizophora mucronata TaxID=61149 RepID=A0A2P2NXT8_RHIMU
MLLIWINTFLSGLFYGLIIHAPL